MMNVGSGPFVPQQGGTRRCVRCGNEFRGRGAGDGMCSDRCWMASRGRQATQGETLGRAFGETSLRAERRRLGNARVTRMLRDAAAENDIRRYQETRRGTLALIERLEGRAPRRARTVTRSAPLADCPECRKLAARYDLTPEETAEICRGANRAQPSGWSACRHCGVPLDRCACGGMAVR